MVRWEPGARERLQEAALDLYATKGFEETTVVEIAQFVGLTERTFYRYFADKREVIFAGQDLFQKAFIDGVVAATKDSAPLEVVASAVISAADFFGDERREYSRRRSTVIAATPELRERELLKMAALATAIAAALGVRGVPEPAATLSAESGVTVFRLAFAQWIAPGSRRSLVDLESEIFAELGALSAPTKASP